MAADKPGAVAGRKGPVLAAGVIGGLAGAALAGHRGARAASVSAAAGAAGLAAAEAVARARQRPGEIPPLWQRIATSAALVAPKAEHAFSLFGLPFLVLHYTMHRKG